MRLFKKNRQILPYFSKEAWQYYMQFFKGQGRKMIAVSAGSTAQAALIIPILLLVRYIFDVAIPAKDVVVLIYIGLAIIGIRLINAATTLFLRKINIKIVTTAIFKLREDLMIKVLSLSRSFYTHEDQRVLHTRIVQDTERIMRMSNALISSLIPAILISIGLGVILLVLNWFLFLAILLFFPVIFFSSRFMGKIVKKRVFAYQRAFEGFSKGVMFVMKFLDLIKVQSAEPYESQKQIETLRDLQEKTTRRTYFFAVNGQVQTFLVGISGIIVIVIGGISVIKEIMTIGDFFAFYIAANRLQSTINTITSSFANIVTGNESLITLYDIASNRETEPYSGNKKIDFSGDIKFESVSFKYTEKPVLKDISLQLTPNSRLAIIGANGAGKSTIINLILGFYAPQSGNITADGIPFLDVDFQHFRRYIGVVSQHPLLIPGTIRYNIDYGSEWANEQDVLTASKLALAHDFIAELPDGYETQIGEDGVLLSGGERQKIAIARALLRRPKLLILDEPTNHFDLLAVKKIMQSIQDIDYSPAILIISHDMQVVSTAKQIFILEDGYLNPYKN